MAFVGVLGCDDLNLHQRFLLRILPMKASLAPSHYRWDLLRKTLSQPGSAGPAQVGGMERSYEPYFYLPNQFRQLDLVRDKSDEHALHCFVTT